MAVYSINKGIGKQVEFKGLRAQYLFIFAGGLLGVFLLFVIMYLSGISPMICIGFGISLATGLVWATFRMNRKYGAYGLMKAAAARSHPRRIIHRRRIERLLRQTNQRVYS